VTHDVAIVGAGPAGTAAGVLCVRAGLRTVIVERAKFPREKVCGDCINPRCWPLLDELDVADSVAAAAHAPLDSVAFSAPGGLSVSVPLPAHPRGEIAIKRSLFDNVLLQRAVAAGVRVHEGVTLTRIARSSSGWSIESNAENYSARILIAADGRNSTVARLLGILPNPERERVALQAHIAANGSGARAVALRFQPWGYCGVAPVNERELNVCLVTTPSRIEEAKQWAADEWPGAVETAMPWRTITPLTRAAVHPGCNDLLLAGDAARVVEPFTGEGIYYALASGILAARCIAQKRTADYPRLHRRLYRGRLWINRTARWATLHPRATTNLLRFARIAPGVLEALTRRVVRVSAPRLLP
jgi:geranylgeranyl reductase family protein